MDKPKLEKKHVKKALTITLAAILLVLLWVIAYEVGEQNARIPVFSAKCDTDEGCSTLIEFGNYSQVTINSTHSELVFYYGD